MAVVSIEAAIETGSTLGNNSGTDLQFDKLCVEIKKTAVLKNVCGCATKGNMLAIMGPSGSGKSTLLNAIYGKFKIKSGTVTFGGQPMSKRLRRRMSYVLQQDNMYASLNLKETLYFMSKLRLPESLTEIERQSKIDEVVRVLELDKCLSTQIGDASVPGLSGGEKKRANIACELLSNPDILLLDEPTTGLDYAIAFLLVRTLQKYAQERNKILITTIHQPSSKMFYMFHRVLLVCSGQSVFFGSAADVVPHFARIDLTCDEECNPADFLMDVLKMGGTTEEDIVQISNVRSQIPRQIQSVQSNSDTSIDESGQILHGPPQEESLVPTNQQAKWPTGFWTQYSVLSHREFLLSRRSFLNKIRVGQTCVMALAVGVFYWQLPRRDDYIFDRLGLITFIMMANAFEVLFQCFTLYLSVKDVAFHQRSTGAFQLSAYYLAMLTCQTPTVMTMQLIITILAYWIGGMTQQADAFFAHMGLQVLIMLSTGAEGLLVAITFESFTSGVAFIIIIGNVSVMLCGFFVQNIPVWIQWMKYFTNFYYANRALFNIEFGMGPPFKCAPANLTTIPACLQENVTEISGQEILEFMDETSPIWIDSLVLITFAVFFHSLGYTGLRFVRKPRTSN